MTVHVEVTLRDEETNRVVRYEADLDTVELLESRISGLLQIIPNPSDNDRPAYPWGAKLRELPQVNVWEQYLVGNWEAKEHSDGR